jgi:protein NrfD
MLNSAFSNPPSALFILFLFLTHLAIGIAWTLILVPRAAGIKFFRFNAGVVVALLAVAAALRPDPAGLSGTWTTGLWLLGVAIAALTLYWATIGRMLASLRGLFLWTGLIAGAGALGMQALALAPSTDRLGLALTALSFVTSAALLGGACTAMVLGHWYLILPSMDIALLKRIVKFHLASLVTRMLIVGVVVLCVIGGLLMASVDFSRYATSVDGVFLWQRVLFGLAGPAVLGWLTWETAKIRSTQSATGILYVDFFTVVVGEVLAKYLLLATRVPV